MATAKNNSAVVTAPAVPTVKSYQLHGDGLQVLAIAPYERTCEKWSLENLYLVLDLMPGDSASRLSHLVEGLSEFCSAVWGDEYDSEDLITVKSAGGVMQAAYGFRVYINAEGALVVQAGNNEKALEVSPQGLVIAGTNITGEIKSKLIESDDDDEPAKRISSMTFVKADKGAFLSFEVNCLLAPDAPEAAILNQLCRSGVELTGIATYFGKGGTGCLRMEELGAGHFTVIACESEEREKDGETWTSYTLELEDGKKVWAEGLVTQQLKNGWDKFPCPFVITGFEPSEDGSRNWAIAALGGEPILMKNLQVGRYKALAGQVIPQESRDGKKWNDCWILLEGDRLVKAAGSALTQMRNGTAPGYPCILNLAKVEKKADRTYCTAALQVDIEAAKKLASAGQKAIAPAVTAVAPTAPVMEITQEIPQYDEIPF